MNNPVKRCMLAVLALCCSTTIVAQAHDPRFGTAGHQTHGFALVNGYDDDQAIVACAGPGGTLVVSGLASNTERVVTIRIREDGALDTSFSGDGKESFNLPIRPLFSEHAVGACQNNGQLLLAIPAHLNGEEDLQLIRVDAQTGLPDPGFGNAGFLTIDMDLYATGLGTRERPLGLNIGSDGVIELTGQVLRGENTVRAGFIARIGAEGAVLAAAVPALSGFLDSTMTTAGIASDGQLWVSGHGFRSGLGNTYFRAVLNPQTLTVQSIPVRGTAMVDSGRGRFVGPDVMVNTIRRNSTAADGTPTVAAVLLIHRNGGTTELALPTLARLDGQTTAVHHDALDGDVIALPDGRLLLSGSIQSPIGASTRGVYFSAVQLADGNDPDRIDTRFGNGGLWQTGYVNNAPGCTRASEQAHHRTTLWNGRATLVGYAYNGPCDNSGSFDYWISRLRVELLFGSGFE